MTRLTAAQIAALEAAVDVAYDDTPADDAARLEMEADARQALVILKGEPKTRKVLESDLMEDR